MHARARALGYDPLILQQAADDDAQYEPESDSGQVFMETFFADVKRIRDSIQNVEQLIAVRVHPPDALVPHPASRSPDRRQPHPNGWDRGWVGCCFALRAEWPW